MTENVRLWFFSANIINEDMTNTTMSGIIDTHYVGKYLHVLCLNHIVEIYYKEFGKNIEFSRIHIIALNRAD